MSSVDDRIVNMQFNNSQFTTGAADASRSLQSLEQTIAKTGSAPGLENMGASVDGIGVKFGALQVAAVAALGTIVSKATMAGLDLLKAFTIDPLLQGFEEYETNLNSIQTIMANTGAEIKVVNAYLDELNEYSDLTIYNFSQMAENIGRFTAAGVKLRDATDAIKGLANTAALSGSNVQQLNTAMYQMSQALSTGTIRLMDWNSLANAGMGGENIRNALMATTRALGTNEAAMDEAITTAGSFRDSLQYGWLTAETFTETMKVMAGTTLKAKDTVGLTNEELKKLGWAGKEAGDTIAFTVEQLKEMGYSTEAAIELNRLSQAAIDSAQDVKTFSQLIQVVKESIGSGWAQVFENLFGNFEQAKSLWTGVSDTITGFVKTIFDSVNKVLGQWNRLGGYQALWSGIGNIFEALGNLIQPFVTAFQSLLPTAKSSSSTLIGMTKGFESFTEVLVTLTEGLDILTPVISAVFGALGYIAGIVIDIVKELAPVIGLIGDLAAKMGDLAKQGIEIGKSLIAGVLEGMGIADVKAAIENFATSLVDWFKSALGIASPAAELVPVGEAIVMGIAEGIVSAIQILGQALASVLDAILELLPVIYMKLLKIPVLFVQAIAGALPPLRVAMVSIIETILGTIGDAIPALVGLINTLIGAIFDVLITNIPKLAEVMTLLTTELLGYLVDAVPLFIETGLQIILAIAKGLAEAIPTLAGYAVDIIAALAGAIVGGIASIFGAIAAEIDGALGTSLGSLDWAKIFNALLAGGLVAALYKISSSISNFLTAFSSPFGELTNTLSAMQNTLKAQALMAIAIAVGVLAAALIGLALLKSEQLNQGLGAITAMVLMLSSMLLILNKINPAAMAGITSSLILMAGAMTILAVAVAIFGNMDLGELGRGFTSIAAGLGLFVLALKGMSTLGGGLAPAAASILILAGAMLVLSAAMQVMSTLSFGNIAAGLTVMAGSLAMFVTALSALSSISATVGPSALGILILSASIVVLATALTMLSKLSLGNLAAGLITMAISLGLFVLALGALALIGPAGIVAAQSILVMSAAMLVLAVALNAMAGLSVANIATGLIAIAAALAILLVAAAVLAPPSPIAIGLVALAGSMLALGAGVALLGIGLLAGATAFSLFAAVGMAGITVLLAGFSAFMALLPTFAAQLALAIVSFIETIADMAPRLRVAFGQIIKAALGVLSDALPELRKLGAKMISELLKAIKENAKPIEEIMKNLLKMALNVLEDSIPRMTNTGMDIALGVLTGIKRRTDEFIDVGTDIIVKVIRGIGNASERIVTAATNAIEKFVNALAPAVRSMSQTIGEAGWDIAMALAQGLYAGIITKGLDMARDAATALANALPEWMQKILGIDSPSKVAHWWGEMIVAGLVNGIVENTGRAVFAVLNLANAMIAEGDAAVLKAQRAATKRQFEADSAMARAKIAEQQAKEAEKRARQSPKNKELQKEAEEARKIADKKAKAADKAQKAADAAAQHVADVQAFREADAQGKGDILTEESRRLAERSAAMLAQANEQAKAAKKLHGDARKKMLREARKSAQEARRLAQKSKEAQQRADGYYETSVLKRIEAIKKQEAAERKQKQREKKFNQATDEGKAEILRQRAEAERKRAARLEKQSDNLVKRAKKLADTDAAKAQQLLDKAAKLAQQAKAQADKAKADRDAAKDYADQADNPDPDTPTGAFQLSRTAMEDAASAIDRYTKSLQQAEEAALAATPVYQFVQNNNSPESLSDATIYRQSKNLLSAAETKMAVPTP